MSAPVNAANQYVRQFKYDLANGKIPKGKYTIPAAALASAGLAGFVAAPVSFIAGGAGAEVGGKTFDFGTKLVTGKSWADWLSNKTGLDKEVATMTNPGMIAGGAYGGWVGNNFSQLGRYTLNYLDPRGYGNYLARLKDVYTKPFYAKPPTFYNGKKPRWFGNQGFFNDDEIRFQNGAIWAGIPEEEVPRTLIQKNIDGTYRFTREAIEKVQKSTEIPFEDMVGLKDKSTLNGLKEGEFITEQDWLTSVGGEHSDYILRQNNPRSLVWEFRDEQKLNPQWQIAMWLKKKFNLSDNSPSLIRKGIDKVGGANLSWSLGYKPFTYRQGILLDKNSNWRLFFDPAKAEKYGFGQTKME